MLPIEWSTRLPISSRRLAEAVKTRLTPLTSVTVYTSDIPTKPPTLADGSGRVKPYAILNPTPGQPSAAGEDLADTHLDHDGFLALTVVAGWLNDCLDATDRIHHRLFRWAPAWDDVIDEDALAEYGTSTPLLSTSGLRPPIGWQATPVLRETDATPPRFSTGLQYRLTITT